MIKGIQKARTPKGRECPEVCTFNKGQHRKPVSPSWSCKSPDRLTRSASGQGTIPDHRLASDQRSRARVREETERFATSRMPLGACSDDVMKAMKAAGQGTTEIRNRCGHPENGRHPLLCPHTESGPFQPEAHHRLRPCLPCDPNSTQPLRTLSDLRSGPLYPDQAGHSPKRPSKGRLFDQRDPMAVAQ